MSYRRIVHKTRCIGVTPGVSTADFNTPCGRQAPLAGPLVTGRILCHTGREQSKKGE
jgi:hypothetical protein